MRHQPQFSQRISVIDLAACSTIAIAFYMA
jgi:hypothetical protein